MGPWRQVPLSQSWEDDPQFVEPQTRSFVSLLSQFLRACTVNHNNICCHRHRKGGISPPPHSPPTTQPLLACGGSGAADEAGHEVVAVVRAVEVICWPLPLQTVVAWPVPSRQPASLVAVILVWHRSLWQLFSLTALLCLRSTDVLQTLYRRLCSSPLTTGLCLASKERWKETTENKKGRKKVERIKKN